MQVFEVASQDLYNMGIMVISYTLKDIKDDVGYLASLGQARTAQVKRDALIGEPKRIFLLICCPYNIQLGNICASKN